MAVEGRATIVVLTYNRRVQVLSTLQALRQLPGSWPIIVVDNGSNDGTAKAIRARFPSVLLIQLRRNLGAAARNLGVAYVHTPYVAFCDDDTQWEPGALDEAVTVLDATPEVAVINACIHVGPKRRLDPTCSIMLQSPLPRGGLPGPRLLGFMAGACVMRTRDFFEVGGYWPPLFIGGEEALMALDLVDRGRQIVYLPTVVTRHFPSKLRNAPLRQRLLLRNAIWVAWMRRPLGAAWRTSLQRLAVARQSGIFWRTVLDTLAGLPRVLARRRVVSTETERLCLQLEDAPNPLWPEAAPVYSPEAEASNASLRH